MGPRAAGRPRGDRRGCVASRERGGFSDSGAPSAGGPLQRRAELETLEKEVGDAEANRDRARATEESTLKELAPRKRR